MDKKKINQPKKFYGFSMWGWALNQKKFNFKFLKLKNKA